MKVGIYVTFFSSEAQFDIMLRSDIYVHIYRHVYMLTETKCAIGCMEVTNLSISYRSICLLHFLLKGESAMGDE